MASALAVWRFGFFGHEAASAPNPLALIEADAITAASLYRSGELQPVTPERARAVAAAIASLKAAPRLDGRGVNWASATQVRAETADGIVLTLQVVPADAGGVVRITADPAPGFPEAAERAQAIRALRHNAYRLNLVSAAALLPR